MAKQQESSQPEDTAKEEVPKREKTMFDDATFSVVRFHEKSNETDKNSVELSCQGFVLVCQRGVQSVVPDFMLEVSDHATYPKFTVRPGEGRKVATHIRKFPYDKIRSATFAEFQKFLKEGSEKTKRLVEKHGLNIPVELAVPQE